MSDKLAILSDIHGNYEALQAVLEDMDKFDINTKICLGDNIGYGPDPNLVTATLKVYNIESTAGNHELAILNPELRKWFNPFARESIEITESMLTQTTFDLIEEYPEFITKGNMRFVHGTPPDKILTYIFEISPEGIIDILDIYPEKYCFVGHTHLLKLVSFDGEKIILNQELSKNNYLDDNSRYIINAGSTGQPRDGDKRAKYIIFDREDLSLEVRYVKYNREKTRKKILERGFPAVYASMI